MVKPQLWFSGSVPLERNNKAALAVGDVSIHPFGLETFTFSDRMELAMHNKAPLSPSSYLRFLFQILIVIILCIRSPVTEMIKS